MLPFSIEEFLSIFATYNAAIWPIQIVAYLVGAAAVALVFAKSAWKDRAIAIALALTWFWTGIAYHGMFFSAINKPAYLFGALFAVQGLYFVFEGVVRPRMAFSTRRDLAGWIGYAFIAYAMVIYPLLGIATGHTWSEMPMFGVTPCPVAIFTFGMLLLATGYSRWLLVIPVIWSLIGGSAAFLLGVQQDWLLLVSGVTAIIVLAFRKTTLPAGRGT